MLEVEPGAKQLAAGANPYRLSRIVRDGLIATMLAALINGALAFFLRSPLDVSPEFGPLQVPAVMFFSALGALFGTAVFAVITRRSRRPVSLFRRIALVAMLLSLLQPVALRGVDDVRFHAESWAVVAGLMLLHVVAWVVTVWMLTSAEVDGAGSPTTGAA